MITILRLTDAGILVIVFLAMITGHWSPWRVVPGVTNRWGMLRRVAAYAYGVSWILAGLAVWSSARWEIGVRTVGVWEPVLFLSIEAVVAGLTVIGTRVVEMILDHRALRGDVKDYEQAIEKAEPRT